MRLKFIANLFEETKKATEINQEIREDIFAALSDFQTQLDDGREIKRYSIKNLLGLTADVSTLSGFAIQLGQILGYIPNKYCLQHGVFCYAG
jgi:hypothetical protein